MPRNKPRYTTRYIALVALITALCVVGRYLFQFIPNVQPVTDIIIFMTLTYGFVTGSYIAILSILISNVLLGFGIWTLPQLFAYLMVVGCAWLVSHWSYLRHRLWLQALFSLFAGYLYGFCVSIGQYPLFGGWPQFVAYYLAGLSFDTLHAGGNLMLYFILIPPLNKLLLQLHLDKGLS
ncbi:hypothetical protein [Loigolactobacillus binensis]|uniref:ECF transporter S component n=1 Tax=Loigolactobacillus binensis TaxID=2559922 RepID=A0ABW3EF19_9LACO|nr:hypothetical protein [Loigolactobacillus binensis]